MAAVTLTPADFAAWDVLEQDKLAVLIEDVLAQAEIIAPCIVEDDFPYAAAARATLREAVLRRLDAGTGTLVTRQEGTGPFTRSETIDNRQQRVILRPADVTDLQRLCAQYTGSKADRLGTVNLDPQKGQIPYTMADRPDLWFQYLSPVPPSPTE